MWRGDRNKRSLTLETLGIAAAPWRFAKITSNVVPRSGEKSEQIENFCRAQLGGCYKGEG